MLERHARGRNLRKKVSCIESANFVNAGSDDAWRRSHNPCALSERGDWSSTWRRKHSSRSVSFIMFGIIERELESRYPVTESL